MERISSDTWRRLLTTLTNLFYGAAGVYGWTVTGDYAFLACMVALMAASAYWHWGEEHSAPDRYAIFLLLSYLLAQPTGEIGYVFPIYLAALGAYALTLKSFWVVGVMGAIMVVTLALLNWPYAVAAVVVMAGALVNVAVLDRSKDHTGPSHGAWHLLSAVAILLTHIGIHLA